MSRLQPDRPGAALPSPGVEPVDTFEDETRSGRRFKFGENWRLFLAELDDRRIAEAEQSLRTMLGVGSLDGRTFLDVGSGSGLFSLAARRLGATVRSFDYDPSSVACTAELRRRYHPDDPRWVVERGSALDERYLGSLGQFDVVYSWGVLHHSGDMWKALALVAPLVRPRGGTLFIAIYNDQGFTSRVWKAIKMMYCRLPRPLKPLLLYPLGALLWAPATIKDFLRLRPFETWRNAGRTRGMSPWRDVVDWVGGYPFEVATPTAIAEFFRQRGFTLRRLEATSSLGNNQFIFERT